MATAARVLYCAVAVLYCTVLEILLQKRCWYCTYCTALYCNLIGTVLYCAVLYYVLHHGASLRETRTVSKNERSLCSIVLCCTYASCNIKTILMSFTFSAAKSRFRMKQPQTSRALNHPSHFRRCPRRFPTQQPCTMKCSVLCCAVRNVL